jgi:hypothetical protein
MKKKFMMTKKQLIFLQRMVALGRKEKDARAWINQMKAIHITKRDEYISKNGVAPKSFDQIYTRNEAKLFSDVLCLTFAVKDSYSLIEDFTEMDMNEELDEALKKIQIGCETFDAIIRSSLYSNGQDMDSLELNNEIEETRENIQILLDVYFKVKDKKQFKNLVINLSKNNI